MANDTNSGSFGGSQDQQNQDAPSSLDFGPPATGAGNTASSSQNVPPDLDFGPPATGASDTPDTTGTTIDVTDTGVPAVEEPFVGSGGVGSADYMDALRRGHEQAGGDYSSDLGDTDDTQGGTSTA